MASICFTGKLSKPRKLLFEEAKKAGLEIHTSVTRSTDYLVVPDEKWTSIKVLAALRKGTKLIYEDRFWQMVELNELKDLLHDFHL